MPDNTRETGLALDPKFNADGLITAVATDQTSGDVLMLAHMNRAALDLTISTGEAWFWSRSRQAMWKKGETSGHVLKVRDIRIDCDQDAVWLIVEPHGPACHTGAPNCFYRRVTADGLEHIAESPFHAC
jgi:phosphoribosyl-AMP cyclohydrolase